MNKVTGELMAVKEILIDTSDKYVEQEVKSVEAEIELMKSLSKLNNSINRITRASQYYTLSWN